MPHWIKLDAVTQIETISFNSVKEELIETRWNYIDFDIAFDSYWNMTFLPRELTLMLLYDLTRKLNKHFYQKIISIII